MRITSGTHSIQMFQAQQAFQAKRPAMQEPEGTIPSGIEGLAQSRPELPLISHPGNFPSKTNFQEIQNIARKAGFVGLTERDIQRAYVHGESLFADYRV